MSLTIATQTDQLPIDFELYLGKRWMDDPDRRLKARIPTDIEFRTKPQLALEMVRRALAAGCPAESFWATADMATGVISVSQYANWARTTPWVSTQTPQSWWVGERATSMPKAITVRDLAFQLMAKKEVSEVYLARGHQRRSQRQICHVSRYSPRREGIGLASH